MNPGNVDEVVQATRPDDRRRESQIGRQARPGEGDRGGRDQRVSGGHDSVADVVAAGVTPLPWGFVASGSGSHTVVAPPPPDLLDRQWRLSRRLCVRRLRLG